MQKLKKTRFIQIIGPSGSGKTTLLKKIAIQARENKKGCLFIQQSLEMPIRNIQDSIHVSNHMQTVKNYLIGIGRDKLYEIISSNVSVEKYKFSGGEIQILKLVWTFIYEGIIIADEPYSALDDDTRKKLEKYIFENSKASLIIFTSHRDFSQKCRKINISKCRKLVNHE